MKEVSSDKGAGGIGGGIASELWEHRYEYDGTKLKRFPIPKSRPLALPRELDRLAQELSRLAPAEVLKRWASSDEPLAPFLQSAEQESAAVRGRMIALQEELDWQCYRLYGLIEKEDGLEWPEEDLEELPELSLGDRTFEILMARQMEAGELETSWFARHKHAGSQPITDPSDHWPNAYRGLVERRARCIAENKNINLIERPEYKRRWNTEPWESRQETALRQWLLNRMESWFFDADRMVEESKNYELEIMKDEGAGSEKGEDAESGAPTVNREKILKSVREVRSRFAGGREPKLVTTKQLADAAVTDPQWMEAAQVYRGDEAFDVPKLVRELVEAEAVPFLPSQRYKETGLRHRREWERVWELQRQEDAVEAEVRQKHPDASEEDLKRRIREAQQEKVGDTPVPPKYKTKDFRKTTYWSLRGKLDVPKERWISYPGAQRTADPSPVIAWAGWDHKQLAQALAAAYTERKETDGWEPAQLLPLLAGLKDLLPWLKQWHNEIDPDFGLHLGDFYEDFLRTQCHELGFSESDIEALRIGD